MSCEPIGEISLFHLINPGTACSPEPGWGCPTAPNYLKAASFLHIRLSFLSRGTSADATSHRVLHPETCYSPDAIGKTKEYLWIKNLQWPPSSLLNLSFALESRKL